MPADARKEMLRAARNQSLYREINEKIKDLNEQLEVVLPTGATWVCECADPECNEEMELTLGEYEKLRSHPNHFAVLPGHVYEEVERVVEEHGAYFVVEPLGAGTAYAVGHDPRNPDRLTP